MVIRMDDISSNTDETKLDEICSVIKNMIPDADIWFGVNLFSKYEPKGAVYPDLPLKDKPLGFFWGVDRVLNFREFAYRVCSHGLWHFDHSAVNKELQEASIVTSCNLLKTDVFIPPFNRWNNDTEEVCECNGIFLVKSEDEGFKSFEHNEFDPTHNLWYMHPWRWNSTNLTEYLSKSLVSP